MPKLQIELNREGVAELLSSEFTRSILEEVASDIVSRCGEGYAHDVKQMPTRLVSSVYTETTEAFLDNLERNTILNNL